MKENPVSHAVRAAKDAVVDAGEAVKEGAAEVAAEAQEHSRLTSAVEDTMRTRAAERDRRRH